MAQCSIHSRVVKFFGRRQNKMELSASNTGRKPFTALPWLGIVVVTFGILAFYNSFDGAFVMDDTGHIVNNDRIRSLTPLNRFFGLRRPVVAFSLASNFAVNGLDTWGYHLVNVSVHILAALVLFGILRRTLRFKSAGPFDGISSDLIAFVVSLLWVVHPLQTQSVTYLIQRGESMMGLFYLLVIYCTIRSSKVQYPWGWYIAAIVSSVLALGCKGVAVTAPFLAFLYDRTFLAGSFKEALVERKSLYIGLIATWSMIAVGGLLVIFDSSRRANVGFGYKGVSWIEYLTTQPKILLHYLKLTFWPDILCLDYAWPVEHNMVVIGLTSAVVLAFSIVTIFALRFEPLVGYFAAWFFVILSPTSSFIPIKDMAVEHRMYLPLAGLLLIAVISARHILELLRKKAHFNLATGRIVSLILVIATVGLLSYRTYLRNRDYENEVTMWRSVVRIAPHNERAQQNLGRGLSVRGELDEALRHLRVALRLNPDHVNAHINIGNVYSKQGEPDRAIPHYRRATQINPNLPYAYNNLGTLYQKMKDIDQAIHFYKKALKIKPNYADAHYNIAMALAQTDKLDESIEHFRRAIQARPLYVIAHVKLGVVLSMQGDTEAALAVFYHVLKLDPENEKAREMLGKMRGSSS